LAAFRNENFFNSRPPSVVAALAYLITFCCYGAHLPGQDGIVDNRLHSFGAPLLEGNAGWLTYSRKIMSETVYQLDWVRRQIVLERVQQLCFRREWCLLAAHMRSTHVHVVVGAATAPERIMTAMKAAASAGLNQANVDPPARHRRWARHGSTRYLWTAEDVNAAMHYVLEKQGEEMAAFDGS
jgi:REP element-mobilizing transposase RayT